MYLNINNNRRKKKRKKLRTGRGGGGDPGISTRDIQTRRQISRPGRRGGRIAIVAVQLIFRNNRHGNIVEFFCYATVRPVTDDRDAIRTRIDGRTGRRSPA